VFVARSTSLQVVWYLSLKAATTSNHKQEDNNVHYFFVKRFKGDYDECLQLRVFSQLSWLGLRPSILLPIASSAHQRWVEQQYYVGTECVLATS
jgi:hypothetical protein